MDKIVDHINVNRDHYIDQLKAFLAIPSISALPAHNADTRRCAEWVAAELTRIGLHGARLVETPGHPVVYAEWLGAPGAPTVLFYGHYDVQPVDPLELWTSPPFEATVRDGELFARGAVDDKGQVFMHMKAVEAHLSQTGTLPVNIKFVLEGEEEVGSANLDDFIKANKDLLKADVVVEARDLDAAALVLHLRERLRQRHGRIHHRAAERARVQVGFGAAHVDLEVGQAAQPVADRRSWASPSADTPRTGRRSSWDPDRAPAAC